MAISINPVRPFALAAGSNAVPFIDRMEDGSEIPVAFLSVSEAGTTKEGRMLAENILDYIYDRPLLRRFGKKGRTMHFYAMPSGIVFQYHKHDKKGMSLGNAMDAYVLTIVEGYRDKLLCRMSEAAFSIIPEAGTKEEQRSKPRTHSMTKPSARPNPAI